MAQTIFSNQTVTSNRTVTGTDILSENITVSNGAKLILKGSQSITINKPYTIEKGCQLKLRTNPILGKEGEKREKKNEDFF